MRAGNGRHLRDLGGGDDIVRDLAKLIANELTARDVALDLCAEIEALPLDSPAADAFRTATWQQPPDLRATIAQRELWLSSLPSPKRLYERIVERLDDPDCATEAQHAALIAEGISASLAAIAAQVKLLAELRRRGIPL